MQVQPWGSPTGCCQFQPHPNLRYIHFRECGQPQRTQWKGAFVFAYIRMYIHALSMHIVMYLHTYSTYVNFVKYYLCS